jgi:hypothetical protein
LSASYEEPNKDNDMLSVPLINNIIENAINSNANIINNKDNDALSVLFNKDNDALSVLLNDIVDVSTNGHINDDIIINNKVDREAQVPPGDKVSEIRETTSPPKPPNKSPSHPSGQRPSTAGTLVGLVPHPTPPTGGVRLVVP